MARENDRDQNDRDQNDRGRRSKPRQVRQGRPGDVILDDTFSERFLFRALTDVIGDAGLGLASAPAIKAGLQALSAKIGPELTRVLVTGASAAAQNPSWNDADKAIENAREKYKADRPPPRKTYLELFMALSPSERKNWDQILARLSDEQKKKFEAYRPQFTTVEVLRAALQHAELASEHVDDASKMSRKASALIELFERHFEQKAPPPTAKLGAFVGSLVKKAQASLAKTFEVLPEAQRTARYESEMAKIAARRNKYK